METAIYIDQNIILKDYFPYICNIMNNKGIENCFIVYSDVHFEEIKRASDPKIYLDALDNVNAFKLTMKLDNNFKYTGINTLNLNSVNYLYDEYLKNINDSSNYLDVFNPLICFLNGNKDKSLIDGYLDNIQKTKLFDNEYKFDILNSFLYSYDNDIEKIRKFLNCSNISDIENDVINNIWKRIISKCPDIAEHSDCDSFFGFKNRNIYEGINACCGIMDIIGYRSEKKCRKLYKIDNVISDARHIAMASFCTYFITNDNRAYKRSKAIYEYKNIPTISILTENEEENER